MSGDLHSAAKRLKHRTCVHGHPRLGFGPGWGFVFVVLASVWLVFWGFAGQALAHRGPVGIVQARVTPSHVVVLLKMRAPKLLAATFPEQGEEGSVSLLNTEEGKGRVLDLLLEDHSVKTDVSLCERDKIERFELTPSREWMDLIVHYRCPRPRRQVDITIQALLKDGRHHYVGQFVHPDGSVRDAFLSLQEPTYTYVLDEQAAAAKAAAASDVQAPAESEAVWVRWGWLLGRGDWGWVALVLRAAGAGERRWRWSAAGVGLAAAVAMSFGGLWGAPGAPFYAGVVGMAVLAVSTWRHVLGQQPVERADVVMAALAGVGIGWAAGGAQGMHKATVWEALLLGLGVVLAAVAGHWISQRTSPRWRRGTAFVVFAVLVFLGVGELALLADR